jgi:hypothetical protein
MDLVSQTHGYAQVHSGEEVLTSTLRVSVEIKHEAK